MKDWSIIFPSRGRVPLLTKLLESLAAVTQDTTRLEVLVAIDLDDTASCAALRFFECEFPFCHLFRLRRQLNLSRGYYNFLAKESTGRYVQGLNDDVTFLSSWEPAVEVLDTESKRWPDGAVYGRCKDSWGAPYACFPVLSRQAIDVAGWFFYPRFPAHHADVHLHQLWSAAGRVVDLPFAVDHLRHQMSYPVAPDSTHLEMLALNSYPLAAAAIEIDRVCKELACPR